ncbi:MAG: beta-hexosaminidase [Firmicutes bacterium]|nr:beta-hexosaminidase [Bacillota bacterium]
MCTMINLKANPFSLTDEAIAWVKNTLASMDIKAKVGQLFCPIAHSQDRGYLDNFLTAMQPGGILFRPEPGAEIQASHNYLQQNSKVPLLITANLEVGGNGSALEGCFYGYPMQAAATGNEEMAYRLGMVAGREGGAVGCNWAFAPIVDIDRNYKNPITNLRTYGSNPDTVLKMAKAYMRGAQESGIAVSAKHFPGDGSDDRDQHLHVGVNNLSVEEWDATYGRVYKGMIEAGTDSIMVGHIMLPEYTRALLPGISDQEILPASMSPEIIQKLLREKLGFNGVVIIDASPMGGFTMAEKRELAIPKTIAAGCDMFLFNRNVEEDMEFMLAGIERGILTVERIDEAVTRILALKASIGLHNQKQTGEIIKGKEKLELLNCQQHKEWAQECADLAVTLVKDTQKALPLSPEKHKRIWLFVLGEGQAHYSQDAHLLFKELLEQEGFEVEIFDKVKYQFAYMGISVKELKEKYDAAIYFANIEPASNKTVMRVNWSMPMGCDMPWFINEIPTIGVSVGSPYLLQDIPQLKTLINGYSGNEAVVKSVVEKLLGRSPFKGGSPVDPYCGYWEAKR